MQTSNNSWNTYKKLIETPDVPDLGPAPRASRLPLAELNRKVGGFFEATEFDSLLADIFSG